MYLKHLTKMLIKLCIINLVWTGLRCPQVHQKEFMDKLVLLLLIVGLHVYWIYSVATYDWSNFEKDQEQAKKDFF